MSLSKDSKIYVAGHRGLVGSAIWNNLLQRGYTNLVGRTHKELDLTDQQAVRQFFDEERPDAVVMGLPLLTDGTESMTTRQVRNVTERLKRRVPLPFYFMSELLSSEAAERELREVGRTGRRCKAVLDQQAAVRILESFLSLSPDQRRPA